MELNSLLLAIISFLATIGSIESQWNSRSDRNPAWQGHRGNYTGFSPNSPSPGSSSFTGNHYGNRTTPQPSVWAGGNSHYNGSYQPHGPNYQYNSSGVYPGVSGSRSEGSNGRGTPWTETRPSDTGRTNSTRLYPSLDYFRGRSGNPNSW